MSEEKKPQQVDVLKLSDFEISLLILERDVSQYRVERYDELLNKVGAAKGFVEAQMKTWNPNNIKWSLETGAKGSYERYPAKDQKAEATDDYKNMLQDLKEHKGAMNRDGYFYWVFQDQATVGRRQKLKSPEAKTTPATAPTATPSNIFPKELADMLVFEETANWTIIKPRQYLGSEAFAKIASIVKEHGGDYISAGKESHFRLPKTTAK